MKKIHDIIIFLCSCMVLSCLSNKESIIIDERLDDYLYNIGKIYFYKIDQSKDYIIGDIEKPDLYTEREIRLYGDVFIFNPEFSQQAYLIAILLYYAESIQINEIENVVKSEMRNGLTWYKDVGFVIDIYNKDDKIINTFIMQNGLSVFYEKGKEGIYYKVPPPLLKKYFITWDECVYFLKNVKDGTRGIPY